MKNDLALLTLTHECKTLVHSMARTKQHVCNHLNNYVIHQIWQIVLLSLWRDFYALVCTYLTRTQLMSI